MNKFEARRTSVALSLILKRKKFAFRVVKRKRPEKEDEEVARLSPYTFAAACFNSRMAAKIMNPS